MKKDYTVIAAIIDRSGSMKMIHRATVDGLNEYVAEQKQLPGTVDFMFNRFDSEYEHVFTKNLNDVPTFTLEDIMPRGMTALHDAIGFTVDKLGKKLHDMDESERPENVIVLIMTDGGENSSSYYRNAVEPMVKHQQDCYNWKFVFLGANQDAVLVGQGLGIPISASLTYNANPTATRNTMAAASMYSKCVRSTGAAVFNATDREKSIVNK